MLNKSISWLSELKTFVSRKAAESGNTSFGVLIFVWVLLNKGL